MPQAEGRQETDPRMAWPWPGRVWRGLLLVLLAGYALAAVVSGSGRMAAVNTGGAAGASAAGPGSSGAGSPIPSALSGWPYDSMIARRRADDALAAGHGQEAQAMAARALLSDPVDPAVVGRLGWARMLAGDAGGAEAAFRVSGPMGWREPYTQIYWIGQGLHRGQAGLSAQRLDALLRQSPQFEGRDRLFAAITATPEGRAALAGQMGGQPGWIPAFLTVPSDISAQDLANRLDVVGRVRADALDCQAMGSMVNALVGAGMVAQGQAVWRKACGASDALLYDGRLARFDVTGQKGLRTFDWQVTNRGDVSLMLSPLDGDAHELEVRVSGAVSQPVLRQAVVLAPGRYRLSWTMPDLNATQAAMVRVGLGCSLDRGAALPGQPLSTGRARYVRDVVLDDACQARGLIFWIEPGVNVRLSDIQLVRTGA